MLRWEGPLVAHQRREDQTVDVRASGHFFDELGQIW